jgi:hypothetical protein
VFWNFAKRGNLNDLGASMRHAHSRWLTRAVASPRGLPRIPTIAVRDGGFDPIVATPAGRAWAESWWDQTLVRDDLGD